MAANRNQLQTALHKPYDRVLFAKEVLNPVFGSSFSLGSNLVSAQVIPNKSESAAIDKVWIYGNIQLDDDTDVTCYEILLQPKVRIEHSKVAIQHYVRKLLTAGQAALINFVAPVNKNIWRLTLVAKDSELTEKGVKEKITHAKRYTYLLGPNETCKTAAERFETLSIEKEITFQTLVNAFSVEKLSKAFFDEYTLHYANFVDFLTKSNYKKSAFNGDEKAIRDFSKKLLGRIVFLYFVQKKGWLGATDTTYKEGMNDFMKAFFKMSGGNEGFYSNWLTVLFFETLNKERPNDDFKMPDGKKVKVPFLNGGLFEREEYDEHLLTFKTKLFHNADFEDAILTEKNRTNSRGFLDFLNAFNFTVYEDSPDDHTVAVDPEMLGHIFENLLEDNKDKGAFYTPKEIVHYMCQESLIEYLTTHLSKEYIVYKTFGDNQIEIFGNESRTGQLKMVEKLGDKALNRADVEYIVKQKDISKLTQQQLKRMGELLDTVKICDPAIGSGAFPMGLLQEIFSIKELINYERDLEWKPANIKLNIIQNSIYGVDIEKGAVDIARLRFWLSLVVDEEKPKALPNLDYKIIVGDSLVSRFDGEIVEIDWTRKLSVGKADEYVKNVQQLLVEVSEKQSKYFKPDNKNKKKLSAEIRNLKLELLVNQLAFNKEQYINKTEHKGGFMPTANDIKNNNERKIQIAGFDRLIAKLKVLQKNPDAPFKHFDWKLDFPEVLNPYLVNENGGFDIVIANPPYVDIKSLPPDFVNVLFKNFITSENRINLYSVFIEKGWELANKRGNLCYINPNSLLLNSSYKKVRNLLINNLSKIIKLPDNIFINAIVETIIIQAQKDRVSEYTLGAFYKNDEQINFSKLRFNQFKISEWLSDSGLRFNIFISAEVSKLINKIEKNSIEPIENYFDFSLGITPYDKYKGHSKKLIEEKGFHSKKKIDKTYVPLISGSNVLKYSVLNHVDEFLKYGDWLGAPRQKRFFTSPRVIVRQIISGNPPSIYAGYTEEELYHTQIGFSIIKKTNGKYSPKFLCAFLNSTLINFYHRYKYTDPEKNTFQKILIENCRELPLKTSIPILLVSQIETIVSYILFLKPQTLTAITDQLMSTYLEQVIDGMVYEIYFPELLKKHNREIIKHLGELPEFTEGMSDEQKMKICKEVFNRLNEKEHPVRINLFYMNSIPEIAIIEGKNENN
ncbi:MAG: N-6 DNA methylase [Bacteroidales bacterium]|nr:N-6 DNA methylase [Bacteroidales bacterium]